MKLKRDERLKKLGAALHEYPTAARLIDTTGSPQSAALTFTLRKDKLRLTRKRRPLPAAQQHQAGRTSEELWQFYIQLTEVEADSRRWRMADSPAHASSMWGERSLSGSRRAALKIATSLMQKFKASSNF